MEGRSAIGVHQPNILPLKPREGLKCGILVIFLTRSKLFPNRKTGIIGLLNDRIVSSQNRDEACHLFGVYVCLSAK